MRFGHKNVLFAILVTIIGCSSSFAKRENPIQRERTTYQKSLTQKTEVDSTSTRQASKDVEKSESSSTQDLSLMHTLPSTTLQKLQGHWELVSYQLKDGEDYMEVPIAPTPLELVEHWVFKKSSYRRIMDKKLSFTASYTLLESEKRIAMFEGIHFIVHAKKVRSSIPGVKRPEDFFYGILSEESLILFYLGPTLKKDTKLSQGHTYEKK